MPGRFIRARRIHGLSEGARLDTALAGPRTLGQPEGGFPGTEPAHAERSNGVSGKRGPGQADSIKVRALPSELEVPVFETDVLAIGRQIRGVGRDDVQDELGLRIFALAYATASAVTYTSKTARCAGGPAVSAR